MPDGDTGDDDNAR